MARFDRCCTLLALTLSVVYSAPLVADSVPSLYDEALLEILQHKNYMKNFEAQEIIPIDGVRQESETWNGKVRDYTTNKTRGFSNGITADLETTSARDVTTQQAKPASRAGVQRANIHDDSTMIIEDQPSFLKPVHTKSKLTPKDDLNFQGVRVENKDDLASSGDDPDDNDLNQLMRLLRKYEAVLVEKASRLVHDGSDGETSSLPRQLKAMEEQQTTLNDQKDPSLKLDDDPNAVNGSTGKNQSIHNTRETYPFLKNNSETDPVEVESKTSNEVGLQSDEENRPVVENKEILSELVTTQDVSSDKTKVEVSTTSSRGATNTAEDAQEEETDYKIIDAAEHVPETHNLVSDIEVKLGEVSSEGKSEHVEDHQESGDRSPSDEVKLEGIQQDALTTPSSTISDYQQGQVTETSQGLLSGSITAEQRKPTGEEPTPVKDKPKTLSESTKPKEVHEDEDITNGSDCEDTTSEQVVDVTTTKDRDMWNDEGALSDEPLQIVDDDEKADENLLSEFVFATCSFQPNRFAYKEPVQLDLYVTGQIAFREKKSGGGMEMKASLYGLSPYTTPREYAIAIHEYGNIAQSCEASGEIYGGTTARRLSRGPLAWMDGEGASYGQTGDEATYDYGFNKVSVQGAWTAEDSLRLVGENSILGRAAVVHAIKQPDVGLGARPDTYDAQLACCTVARSYDATPWI